MSTPITHPWCGSRVSFGMRHNWAVCVQDAGHGGKHTDGDMSWDEHAITFTVMVDDSFGREP